MTGKIVVLPGDGIGPEVMSCAVEVIKHVANRYNITFEFTEKPFGGTSIDMYGEPLTKETLQSCDDADAILLGAVGGDQWQDVEHWRKPEAGLLKLRSSLELYANIRPVKVYETFLNSSSLKAEYLKDTDIIIVRELTGGIYFGEPRGYDDSSGWNTMTYTKPEVERIARLAYSMARQRKGMLTSVDKANVLECSQFWRSVINDMHDEYDQVELQHMYVDNAAMQLVRDPRQFDVIVTSNMFGDILSDIGGMITGSLGMLPSASLGTEHSLFEPVHGSAPNIAGLNIANPIAMIASAAMMFIYTFEMTQAGEIIEAGIQQTLQHGYRTEDIAEEDTKVVSTTEMTEAIIEQIEQIFNEKAIGVFTL
jgi:3-isopropylmalate dehydrogenase